MERNIHNYAALLMHKPNTCAVINGSEKYPNISGIVYFYQLHTLFGSERWNEATSSFPSFLH